MDARKRRGQSQAANRGRREKEFNQEPTPSGPRCLKPRKPPTWKFSDHFPLDDEDGTGKTLKKPGTEGKVTSRIARLDEEAAQSEKYVKRNEDNNEIDDEDEEDDPDVEDEDEQDEDEEDEQDEDDDDEQDGDDDEQDSDDDDLDENDDEDQDQDDDAVDEDKYAMYLPPALQRGGDADKVLGAEPVLVDEEDTSLGDMLQKMRQELKHLRRHHSLLSRKQGKKVEIKNRINRSILMEDRGYKDNGPARLFRLVLALREDFEVDKELENPAREEYLDKRKAYDRLLGDFIPESLRVEIADLAYDNNKNQTAH